MENKKIVKLFQLFPPFLIRLIDSSSYDISEFISSLSRELPINSRVLDAGAGEAPFKRYFRDHRYFAVDTTWGDCSWDYSSLDVAGDLTLLPIRNGAFDVVIITQVLEHLKEPEKVLKELCRVLREDGSIWLTAPQGWGVHQPPHDYFRFTCFGLQYLLEKSGFKVTFIKPSCGYFGYLANRLTVFPKALFWQIQKRWLRIVLFPLELVSYLFFVLLFPLVLNIIDPLDKKQDYTLNYMVKGKKNINV